jgi:beta-galactosidase
MRVMTSLGASWRYLPRFEPAFTDPALSLESWAEIALPHANIELPYNAFDEASFQFVSSYARDIELPGRAGGKRVFLDFEGVMAACDVWLNGKPAGGHAGGYTPFSVEITDLARPGSNRVPLRVDSTERADTPPFGHVIDYLCYGGIYRGVGLRTQEEQLITGLFARPREEPGRGKAVDVEVSVDPGNGGTALEVGVRLMDGRRPVAEAGSVVDSAGCARVSLGNLEGCRNWDLDEPVLYTLETELRRGGGAVDCVRQRIGFRTAEWRPEGFFLNGRPVPLRGLNRHQSYPHAGYAMPARIQRRDAEILKRELGVNLVRTSHYPQAPAFLDACDELGLLVFEELPGWQHIGDAAWKDNACHALEEMIRRDRNRPSVVLWGVRINESKDDHDFYARTNAIARRLDPTRSTGGVRCIGKSELLEDVYTFNDFIHSGAARALRKPRAVTGLRRGVPYLVTEHNGHMFPTKRFDNEERLAEHARRHARVLDAALGMRGVAGAVGWCAFDYNTHKDFGSGDRICYHGVSDMFRIPKYAAALYASQREPSAGIVLEAASLFAKGERSAARVLPLDVYTNCDEVVLWHGGTRIGSFLPDRKTFPHLPHPPVVIRDLVGDQLSSTRFSRRDRAAIRRFVGKVLSVGVEGASVLDRLGIGLTLLRNRMSFQDGEELVGRLVLGWGLKDESWEIAGLIGGKEVARRRHGGDAVPSSLSARPDDARLAASGAASHLEGWDATRVEVRLLDQYGNISPFAAECIEVGISGPGRIIGPSRMALVGGCIAFWVRTTGAAGDIRVTVDSGRFAAGEIVIHVD